MTPLDIERGQSEIVWNRGLGRDLAKTVGWSCVGENVERALGLEAMELAATNHLIGWMDLEHMKKQIDHVSSIIKTHDCTHL